MYVCVLVYMLSVILTLLIPSTPPFRTMKISTMSTDISAKLHFGFLAFLCLELHVSVSIASSQNITNNTSEALPTLSSLASLKKDGFSFWSDKFRAKLRAGLPAKISIQVLQQQKNKIRPPTASLYQNQVMDTKMKLDMAESQKAPDDATSGLLTKHPAGKLFVKTVWSIIVIKTSYFPG